MSKQILIVDGYIGPYYNSKSYFRNFLTENKKKDVTCRISSLGGDLDTGIDTSNQIAEHGNVTVEYSGFNASAATLPGLKAKQSRIANNSFYLIHKVMQWVDEWGYMNEDDLESIIAKLEDIKEENQKMTLQIVKMYQDKSGKSAKDILDLMKKETWLTADEAVEWGFVDETYEPADQANEITNQMVAMFESNGLPIPKREIPKNTEDKKPSWLNDVLTTIKDSIKPATIENTKQVKHMQNFKAINKVLKVENLESSDDKGVYLNEEQLKAINAQLETVENAVKEKETAETNLTNATNLIDGIDETVKKAETTEEKVNAVRTLLSNKPAQTAAGAQGDNDGNVPKDEADWDTINSLSHNQELDEI